MTRPIRQVRDEDTKLDMPGSLREIIEDGVGRISDEHFQELSNSISERAEKEALKRYGSNERWALRSWLYDTLNVDPEILSDPLDVVCDKVDNIVEPITGWQAQSFDPVGNFLRKMSVAGFKPGTINEYKRVAAAFVAQYGRRERYSDEEIIEFLFTQQQKYGPGTFAMLTRIMQSFLRSLPNKGQELPMKLPPFPDEVDVSILSDEQIDAMIWAAAFYGEPTDVMVRLATATIYGARLGELAELSSKHVNNGMIAIPTNKKGRRTPQPIPECLLLLFSLPFEASTNDKVSKDFRRLAKHADLTLPPRSGWHSIRRAVVTALYIKTDLKELTIRRFLRWSMGMGQGVLPRYVKVPEWETDAEVLRKHPYLSIWEKVMSHFKQNPRHFEPMIVEY